MSEDAWQDGAGTLKYGGSILILIWGQRWWIPKTNRHKKVVGEQVRRPRRGWHAKGAGDSPSCVYSVISKVLGWTYLTIYPSYPPLGPSQNILCLNSITLKSNNYWYYNKVIYYLFNACSFWNVLIQKFRLLSFTFHLKINKS